MIFSLFGNLSFEVLQVQATESATLTFDAMCPSTGDDWTEESPDYWTLSYGTKSWTTSEVQYGSKALNVTHTRTTVAGVKLYFVLSSQIDVSAYEYLFFRAKVVYSQEIRGIACYLQNRSTFSASYPYLEWASGCGKPFSNVWFNVAFALYNGEGKNGGTPENLLNQFRNLYFYISVGTIGSNASIIIDGLRFCTVSMDITPDWLEHQKLHNTMFMMEKLETQVTFKGKIYTTCNSVLNMTSGNSQDEGLRAEALGQLIHALVIAYRYSQFDYFLDKAETYIQLFLAMQDKSGIGYIPKDYDDLTGGSSLWNAWQLAALSQLYDVTQNVTYKNAADDVRRFLLDTMWNATNEWFDTLWNNATQTKKYTVLYQLNGQGACTTALAEYYYYVGQNSTVKGIVNLHISKWIGDNPPPDNWVYKKESWQLNAAPEATSYATWALYYAWQAFSNQTYKTAWENVAIRQLEQETIVGREDSFSSYNCHTNYDGHLTTYYDKWAGTNNIALLTLSYSDHPKAYNLVKTQLFDFWAKNQSEWGWEFRDKGTWIGKCYLPMIALMSAAVQFYNKETSFTSPTMKFSSANITSASYNGDKMTFAIFAYSGKTTTTKVYCGDKGRPETVSGADVWSYDSSTKICTITVTHSSEESITLDWSTPVGGISIPVEKLALLAPYIALAIAVIAIIVGTVYVRKH